MVEVTKADRDWLRAWQRDYGRKGTSQQLLEAVARHRLAGVKAGLDTAANLCGALAETTYDSADAFDAAVGCESFIRAIDPASVGADHDAA